METIPDFNLAIEPKTLVDLVFSQLTWSIDSQYKMQVSHFLEKIKLEDSVMQMLLAEREKHKQIVQNSGFLTDFKPLGAKSAERLKELVSALIHTNITNPDTEFSYSEKLKETFAINAQTESLILPEGYSFIDGAVGIFRPLADYATSLYFLDFLDGYKRLLPALGRMEPSGKDFAVMVYFNRECKEMVRNMSEYHKPINEGLRPTIVSCNEKLAASALHRIKHLKHKGLTNGISEAHAELSKAFKGQQGFDGCHNLHELLREKLFFVDNGEIERLDLKSLAYSERLLEHYNNYFKFEAVRVNGGLCGFMPERAQYFIDENKYNYPWARYCDGFLNEYKKEVPKLRPDELSDYDLRYLKKEWNLPDSNEDLAIQNAHKFGQQMARIYKSWEDVIPNLQVYERLLFGDSNKLRLPVIDVEKYDPIKIYNTFGRRLLFKCSKDVFNDWFVKGVGNKRHVDFNKDAIAYVGQTVALLRKITGSEDIKQAYIKKVFGVPVNTNQYNTTVWNYQKELDKCVK
jgi:hypothetical protein